MYHKKLKAKHVVVKNNSRNLIIRDVYQYNAKNIIIHLLTISATNNVHQLIKKLIIILVHMFLRDTSIYN